MRQMPSFLFHEQTPLVIDASHKWNDMILNTSAN